MRGWPLREGHIRQRGVEVLKTTTSCPLEYGGPRSALPGTAAEIAEFEQRAGWQLDPDLRAFYLHCNGAELCARPVDRSLEPLGYTPAQAALPSCARQGPPACWLS